ncbi:hypothetical protein ABQE22_13055 [Enterococcus durans]|uniref:hypothetical protein n=1 Tax=Enterococcus durans TaxID=53345 RepID=UPI00232B2F43|nr:hypothetical protein [Enterococcus durans]WCG28507.1 hypothetical protein PML98_04690 [Enterococcus durans]WCG70068.1 hypothetical protein PML92_04700 [Enterococcus durans]
MKKCLFCAAPLKLMKFKCKDGYICKNCYEIVSLNFSQTVKNKGKEELKQIYEKHSFPQKETEFEITRTINQLVLFDEKNALLCLPNHLKYCKEKLKPEIFSFSSINNCQVERKQTLVKEKKKEQFFGTIKIIIRTNQVEKSMKEIWLIPNPIQVNSLAYKTMDTLAEKIKQEIEQVQKGVVSC